MESRLPDPPFSRDSAFVPELSADHTEETLLTLRSETSKLPDHARSILVHQSLTCPFVCRITRAFMIEEINSIKQKATASDGSKKKKRGGKKSKK